MERLLQSGRVGRVISRERFLNKLKFVRRWMKARSEINEKRDRRWRYCVSHKGQQ